MTEDTFSEMIRKTAEEVAQRVSEAAQQTKERIGEMLEVQRITQQINGLKQERDRCRFTMADLVIRMFDQQSFADALLRPEYARIKEIDAQILVLEKERDEVKKTMPPADQQGEPSTESAAGEPLDAEP